MKLNLKANIPTPLNNDATVDLAIECTAAEAIELNRQLKDTILELIDVGIQFKKNDMKNHIEKLRVENKQLSEELYKMRKYNS